MKKILLTTIITTQLLRGIASAQTISDSTLNNKLQTAIQQFTNTWVMRHASVGVCVERVSTGERLAAHNPELSLTPASNTKLLTTATALGILGDTFRFHTDLEIDGEQRGDTLFGNVYLKGYGDPTLGSPEANGVLRMGSLLDNLAYKIKELGIKKIVGKVVGDGTAFETGLVGEKWLYEDLGNYYGAGISALNLHENFFYLKFRQNPQVGFPPKVESVEPQVPNFQVINEVTSAQGGGDNSYIFGVPYGSLTFVRGTIPAGDKLFSIKGAVTDPCLFAAWHLREKLKAWGVEVTDSAMSELQRRQQGGYITARRLVHRNFSPRLGDLIFEANQESINLWCEAFLKAIDYRRTGIGSAQGGVREIKNFWGMKGVSTEGWFQEDGSGLSPQNAVPPSRFTHLLRLAAKDSLIFPALYASLPRAGESGTMKSMLKKTQAVGRLRAKSGTLTRVKCYSGYVSAKNGELIAFSIMVNHYDGKHKDVREAIENLMKAFCEVL
jgi:D-alanyl-D-alanine carboxypeptidase/D-alanyl-D-alanine-endopeptidase (penicillin-binding protein 4)